jgi:AcrR family transcriptional regulator
VYDSQGAIVNRVSPERLVTLLWRGRLAAPARRGSASGLTTDHVVETAIALAGQEGLEGITIRRLGNALQVPAMTLYTHIESRAVLTELMVDACYSQMEREAAVSDGWQERIGSIARDNRRLHARHPWILDVVTPRTVIGPGALAKYEHELGALSGAGLDDVQTDAALTFLLGVVENCARIDKARARVEAESALSDLSWWEKVGPVLATVYDAEEFPLATRIGTAAGGHYGTAEGSELFFQFAVSGAIAAIQHLGKSIVGA